MNIFTGWPRDRLIFNEFNEILHFFNYRFKGKKEHFSAQDEVFFSPNSAQTFIKIILNKRQDDPLHLSPVRSTEQETSVSVLTCYTHHGLLFINHPMS